MACTETSSMDGIKLPWVWQLKLAKVLMALRTAAVPSTTTKARRAAKNPRSQHLRKILAWLPRLKLCQEITQWHIKWRVIQSLSKLELFQGVYPVILEWMYSQMTRACVSQSLAWNSYLQTVRINRETSKWEPAAENKNQIYLMRNYQNVDD